MTVKREFELSEEDAAFIDDRADAEKAKASEVIGSAIKMLREEEAAIDRWVKEEVLPSYRQWVADGKPTRSSDEVFADLEARIRRNARANAAE